MTHASAPDRTVLLRRLGLGCIIFVWLAAVCAGMTVLADYAARPGAPGDPPTHWPSDSRISRTPGRATLVILIHPRCPCSRASIGELARIMARAPGLVAAHVLVWKPSDVDEGWERTDLWESAAAIPGVAVMRDDDGAEAKRFGAVTSGQTVLYDEAGRLRFSGGITGARGHAGENAGASAVVASLTKRATASVSSPVFGCLLLGQPAETL